MNCVSISEKDVTFKRSTFDLLILQIESMITYDFYYYTIKKSIVVLWCRLVRTKIFENRRSFFLTIGSSSVTSVASITYQTESKEKVMQKEMEM